MNQLVKRKNYSSHEDDQSNKKTDQATQENNFYWMFKAQEEVVPVLHELAGKARLLLSQRWDMDQLGHFQTPQ